MKETFEDRGHYYLVMELCVGGELMDRIVSQSHFSEKVAARFFQQMLAGVQHCHNNLVVHRCGLGHCGGMLLLLVRVVVVAGAVVIGYEPHINERG